MKKYNVFLILLIYICSLYACKTINPSSNTDSDIDEEISLTDEQIIELEKKDSAIPISDITFEDIERTRKELNYEQRKNYYSALLGKKVKWNGEVAKMWTDHEPRGRNHIDINTFVTGSAKLMHLITNQDLKPISNYANKRVLFIGYIYKVDKKGELYIKTSQLD